MFKVWAIGKHTDSNVFYLFGNGYGLDSRVTKGIISNGSKPPRKLRFTKPFAMFEGFCSDPFYSAWDGDPDKNYLSYKTRLGQAIYNREKGDKIEKPNGLTAVIVNVYVPFSSNTIDKYPF